VFTSAALAQSAPGFSVLTTWLLSFEVQSGYALLKPFMTMITIIKYK
jgi:hypothetical protein